MLLWTVCTGWTGWAGPDPVVYRSFDCPYGLNMMEGNQDADFDFIAGKVLNFF